jgi:hypothetical protein
MTEIGTCKERREFIKERSRDGEERITGDKGNKKTGEKDNEINKKEAKVKEKRGGKNKI